MSSNTKSVPGATQSSKKRYRPAESNKLAFTACSSCKQKHVKCSRETRPCERCQKSGLFDCNSVFDTKKANKNNIKMEHSNEEMEEALPAIKSESEVQAGKTTTFKAENDDLEVMTSSLHLKAAVHGSDSDLSDLSRSPSPPAGEISIETGYRRSNRLNPTFQKKKSSISQPVFKTARERKAQELLDAEANEIALLASQRPAALAGNPPTIVYPERYVWGVHSKHDCRIQPGVYYVDSRLATTFVLAAKYYIPHQIWVEPYLMIAKDMTNFKNEYDANDITPQESSFHAKAEIKIHLQDTLKSLLVDDWENVTKQNQIVPLPHKSAAVGKILDDYQELEFAKRPEDSVERTLLEEVMAGLRVYFDKTLGKILLYPFERQQYTELYAQWNDENSLSYQNGHKSPVTTYGAEHLLRLLVALPELIAQTNMDEQSVRRLREELQKFSTWLAKQDNIKAYFVKDYEGTDEEYQTKAAARMTE